MEIYNTIAEANDYTEDLASSSVPRLSEYLSGLEREVQTYETRVCEHQRRHSL